MIKDDTKKELLELKKLYKTLLDNYKEIEGDRKYIGARANKLADDVAELVKVNERLRNENRALEEKIIMLKARLFEENEKIAGLSNEVSSLREACRAMTIKEIERSNQEFKKSGEAKVSDNA
jgi:chromosome segregation ATPase